MDKNATRIKNQHDRVFNTCPTMVGNHAQILSAGKAAVR